MNFQKKLENIQKKNNSLVCVGLDPELGKIPKYLLPKKGPIFEFNKAIIDSTYDLVCAYKPNIAFYEAEGIKGLNALKKTINYIKKKNKDIIVIIDAKRADIGNTNLGYVKSIFNYFKADAVTVNPYLGKEAIAPFLKRKNKGIIILAKTSNPGAGEFQDLLVNHHKLGKIPLYQAVAYNVAKHWNKNKNCLLVVGATYLKELKKIRKIAPQIIFLIPGIGAQGGDIEKTIKAGKDNRGAGMIINSSRGIIFASNGRDFAQAARKKTAALKNLINKYRRL